MQEYNIFFIKDEIINNNDYFIYKVLKKLYCLKSNFNFGINIYNQFCNKVNTYYVRCYLNNKYNLSNDKYFFIDDSMIELRKSRIIIKTNDLNIIKDLKNISNNIFVCDFNNDKYFKLS